MSYIKFDPLRALRKEKKPKCGYKLDQNSFVSIIPIISETVAHAFFLKT